MTGIIKFTKNNYKLVIVVSVMLVGFILWITGFGRDAKNSSGASFFKKKPEETLQPVEESTTSEIAYPLKAIKVDPFFETIETQNSNVPVSIYFSENVDLDTLKITVVPQIETQVELSKLGESVVVIYPKIPWKFGVKYTVTINELASKNNPRNKLLTPYVHNITFIKGNPPAHD